MRLKKVYIQGFKSFADKTTIDVKDGITAIVGPNGSGKSNISDAIRWVLGEQSVKNLRGSKMEDVIFSGTKKRKALGYSEVSITFDNESGLIPLEYTEVEVTRRMFRSGESEYYLNKNSCRLKDVRELFMDTGIGKDGYSIIGQGRIDEILSNKPEDRRNIFEEAAGIVKYRVKKQEAERKLEKVQFNLLRLADLIEELKVQNENLFDQSIRATSFKSLYEEMKDLEISLFARDIERLTSLLSDLEKEKSILNEAISKEKDEKDLIEGNFSILKEEIEKEEDLINQYRDKYLNARDSIEKLQGHVDILSEREGFLLKDFDRIYEEKSSLEEELIRLTNSKMEIDLELKEALENNENLLANHFDLLRNFDSINTRADELDNLINIKKEELIGLFNKSADEKSKINSFNSFKDNLAKRINQLTDEKEKIQEDKSKFLGELDKLLEKKEHLSKDIEIDRKNHEKHMEEEKDILSKLEKHNEELNYLSGQIQTNTIELKTSKDLENSFEGYYKGVKEVLKELETNEGLKSGFLGIVADLLKVDKKYQISIDLALGGSIQNIVTKNELAAKEIIEYLKNNKLGRVTCLPLDIIQGTSFAIKEEDKEKYHILGLGHQVITYDKKYENIFKYLLGRTVVVEDLDYGMKYAKEIKYSTRIISLDGQVIHPGGSFTGGSIQNSKSSILSRKTNMVFYEKELISLNEKFDQIKSKKEEISSNLLSTKNILEKGQDLIKTKESDFINISNEIDKIYIQVDKLDELNEKLSNEIHSLVSEKDSYLIDFKESKDIYEDLDKSIEDLKEFIEVLSQEASSVKESKDSKSKELTDTRLRINDLDNRISRLNDDILLKTESIKDNQSKQDEKSSNLKEIKNDIEALSLEKSEVTLKLSQEKIIEDDHKTKMDQKINEKNILSKRFYEEQSILRDINNRLSDFEKNLNSKEVREARAIVRLDNLKEDLLDTYDLSHEEVHKYKEEIKNITEAQIRVKSLKEEIKELGPVNISSIDEYKEIQTRLDFVIGQEEDLIKAKGKLESVIVDMEDKMNIQFIRNFTEINKNFQEVFGVLFEGGHAELIIEDKTNILSSGIEVNVQPPGKRLQNLSLLSGGEKSLTAVALLFAMLRLRPAPFCILDEIDAALDEANINRYTSYLKNFNKETQFVIITHRKTTMEIADILYGVAMEEEGISKLISVKLSDIENDLTS